MVLVDDKLMRRRKRAGICALSSGGWRGVPPGVNPGGSFCRNISQLPSRDANLATTQTWGVTQRYIYSPYGSLIVLNADFSAPPAGTQPISDYLYPGMTLDAVTGLYYARNRNYSPSLGVWISQDPLQYVNGANTYQMEMSGPVGAVDPEGLFFLAGPLWPSGYHPVGSAHAVVSGIVGATPEATFGNGEYLGLGAGWSATIKKTAVKGGTECEVTVNFHWGIGIGGDVEWGTHKISLEVRGPSLEDVFKFKLFIPCGKNKWSFSGSDSQRVNDTFSGSAVSVIGVEGSFGAYGEVQEKLMLSGWHPLVLSSVIQLVGNVHADASIVAGPLRVPVGFDERGTFALLSGQLTL